MAENLYVGSHKGSTKAFRDGWDRTFRKRDEHRDEHKVTNYCLEENHRELYANGVHICPRCGTSTMPVFHQLPNPKE